MRPRGLAVAVAAPAAAIFVFGVIYGSLARPLIGAAATMLSSLLIFSGSVQFTVVGLLSAGAGAAALVGSAATVNLRNLALGAVMRPRIQRTPIERGGLAWFLTDEAVGLSIAFGADEARIMLLSGATFYVSWQAGTALGLLGASLEAVRSTAEAVFPVLFIGLASISSPSRSIAVRAVIAAAATVAALVLWPGSRGFAALVAAITVAVPGGRQ
jgi:predicted branched-subunit amino acid permease